MQPTRKQILDYLRLNGKGSVKDLGELLGLTSTGIRQHLTILERDGLIEGHEARGRIGRPALTYTLTCIGDAVYPKKYSALATMLLEEIGAMNGDKAVVDMLRRVGQRFAEPYLSRMEGKSLLDRMATVAQIIEEQGCLVAFDKAALVLNRFTCPYPEVARLQHAVCEIDGAFMTRLLDVPVKLESCIAAGDRICTYRIAARA